MSSRRDFLKQLAWGVPAGYLLSTYLFSCKPERSLFGTQSYKGRVAVIGAGIAGLHAASVLQKHGAEVHLYEASHRIGGRIKTQALRLSVNGIPDEKLLIGEPLELGADIIYGDNNLFYDSARSYTLLLENLPEPSEYLIEGERVSLSQLKEDAGYVTYLEFLEKIKSYTDTDKSLGAYLIDLQLAAEENIEDPATLDEVRKIYSRAQLLLYAHVSAEYGILPEHLSIKEYQGKESHKTYGPRRYRMQEDAFYGLLSTLYKDLIPRTDFRSQVEQIDYSGSEVVLGIKDRSSVTVDKVIITVPVATIGDITFTPELPAEKKEALTQIRMGSCTKICMLFRDKFWGDTLGRLYLPLPFSFVMPHPRANVLILYAYGTGAENLTHSGAEAIKTALRVLDGIFGQQMATSYLQDVRVFSWTAQNSEEPFIPGAYSYVVPEAIGARAALAASLRNTIYFAGEATHTAGHASTVQGAMETGYRAAHELLSAG